LLRYPTPVAIRIIGAVARTARTRVSPFHVTIAHILGGDVNITLVAEGFSTKSAYGTFRPGVRIMIGSFDCHVHWIDPSGHLLRFAAPPIESVCPGYRPCQVILTIANPLPSFASIQSLALALDTDTFDQTPFSVGLETSISIPPFLPGAGTVPIASLVHFDGLSSLDSSTSYSTYVQLTGVTDVSGFAAGFTYSRDCPRDDFEVNVTRCGDLLYGFIDPRPRCPFRPDNTSSCTLCPYGAMCPTQTFAYPLPGYWSSHPSSGHVVACRAPSSRCLGFNAVDGRSVCADGYFGFACQSCASGYYPIFGACERCELGTPVMLVLRRVGYFAVALVLAALLVFAVVVAVNKRVGSELYESIRRTIMFVTASIFILQIISQATRALRSSALPMLRPCSRRWKFSSYPASLLHLNVSPKPTPFRNISSTSAFVYYCSSSIFLRVYGALGSAACNAPLQMQIARLTSILRSRVEAKRVARCYGRI
jgi:hypothetical protein